MNYNQLQDALNLSSFIIGILNLEENLTQGDKQDLIEEFNNKTKAVLNSVDSHLREQDEKIDRILKLLEDRGENK